MKILSWNVNGFRAVVKKNFWDWYQKENADIICLQETKCNQAQFQNELGLFYEHPYILCDAQKAGYSGVAVLSKAKPLKIQTGLGDPRYDSEGRTVIAYYPGFVLINLYIPNGGRDLNRIPYKLEFSDFLLNKVQTIRREHPHIILCGDFNVAHQDIDIKNPKANANNSGFTPAERKWMDTFLGHDYIDTFRHLHPHAKDCYTWWSYRPGVRAKNIGWRIDYFIVTQEMAGMLKDSFIRQEVMGSDHCPIGIEADL